MSSEQYALEDRFQTMDGRYPHYIRAAEEAAEEYGRLRRMGFEVLRPGEILSLDEFIKMAEDKGCFEVANPSDANDNGYLMVADFGSQEEASEFFIGLAKERRRALRLSEVMGEGDFVEMAEKGRIINLRTLHIDGTWRVIRGTIIGSSESFLRLRRGLPDDQDGDL
jgi:Zn-dependent alcohol dehydrogenase